LKAQKKIQDDTVNKEERAKAEAFIPINNEVLALSDEVSAHHEPFSVPSV
jgi:hypothetical protein